MNSGKRYLGFGIIVVLIVIGLTVFNRWLMKQIDDIQTEPSMAEKVAPISTVKESERYGKPVIDPYNDPLAPIVEKVSPEVEKKQQISDSPDKVTVYEITQSDSPVLAQ